MRRGFVEIAIILLVVLIAVVGAVVFFSQKKTVPTIPPQVLPQGGPASPPASPRGESQGGQQRPALPGNGPQNDKTYITTSGDGKTWRPGTLVTNSASVPDIIELTQDLGNFKKGDILVYFVDFSTLLGPGQENISVVASEDGGKSWQEKQQIMVKNKPNKGAAVDPSVAQLPDSTLRLYFFGSETTSGDPASVPGAHKVYSAISQDGVNFLVEEGTRFATENLTDPEVISYKNQWYMYYSIGPSFGLATSQDGLAFQKKTIFGGNLGGVPGALVTGTGVTAFACGIGGLGMATSSDGTSFQKVKDDIFDHQIRAIVCDPAAIQTSDGTFLMVYKVKESQ